VTTNSLHFFCLTSLYLKDWIVDRFSTLLIGLDVVNSPNQQHFMGNYNYHFQVKPSAHFGAKDVATYFQLPKPMSRPEFTCRF
jgi:hypothetical protein